MAEYYVYVNPVDKGLGKRIALGLQKSGVIPQGEDVKIYVGVDSNVAITRPASARVEQIFRDQDSGEISPTSIIS